MKPLVITAAIIGVLLGSANAQDMPSAQGSPPQLPTEVQTLSDQLSEVGCRAERITAAQTIFNLQKQVAELQKQVGAAKDPPPPPQSGATKH